MRYWLSFIVVVGCSYAPFSFVHAQLDALPYTVQADEFTFNDTNGTFSATGSVEISNKTETVRADKIEYNQATDTVRALGGVVYKDGKGQTLLVNELILEDNLKAASIEQLRLQTEGIGEVLKADSGTKNGNIYTLKNAAYSPCKTCNTKERKPWQFRAKDIEFDTDENQVRYKHAVLDAYGVPIFYLPYFRHPIGKQDPQNGLLPPSFGTSTNLGEELTLSYYHYLPESNSDYTLRNRYMTSRGNMAILERRQETLTTTSEIKGNIIFDDKRDEWRSNLDIEAEYTLQAGRRFGLNAEVVSDDTYLNDFFGETDNYLPSTLYAEDASQDHYFSAYTTWYQDLETARDPANTGHILPRIQFDRMWATDDRGGQVTVSADALSLHRSVGNRSRRVVAMTEYVKPWTLVGGNRVTFSAQLRGDYYNTESSGDDGNTIRALGHTAFLWERPMISAGGNHIITPMVMTVLAPRGGNSDDIPNEDSVAYELDRNNLFSTNRYAGLDRVENGPRVIYGLDNQWGPAGNPKYRFFLGQSWRRLDDDALPATGGTGTKLSDYVGMTSLDPVNWLSFHSQFRLDNADLNFKRIDTQLRFGDLEKAHLRVVHTHLQDGPEELSMFAEVPLSDNWLLTAQTQRDITDGGRQLYGDVGLEYTHNCYRLSFLTRRRGFTTVDVQPSTDYIVNIELLTLGRDLD